MSADRLTYVDSSAIVKLVVVEPESAALRQYLRRRRPLLSSALARVEVGRALLAWGPDAVRRGIGVLAEVDLVRVNDWILDTAAGLGPAELRSLDAVHLATAQMFGTEVARLVTYDLRMADAAQEMGLDVVAPT